jgi:hypothetical protein
MKNCKQKRRGAASGIVFLIIAGGLFFSAATAAGKNGFDLSDALVPADEILRGGPPRDGIPAIDKPRFVAADAADFLSDDDRVLGMVIGDAARAYPIKILDWHEIVNDAIGDAQFAVTYCPLCGTGAVFDAEVGGEARVFGVSGLLYNSDVLLYDRKSESLFSQLLAQAVSGPLAGEKLKLLPAQHTTWGDFRARYPNAEVLSDDTGHLRDYRRSPYGNYARSETLYFPVANKAPREYHPKEVVLGVSISGAHKAYPYIELDKQNLAEFADEVGGEKITIRWDSQNRSARAFSSSSAGDEEIAAIAGFWFAWFAFHPDTAVFRAAE